MSREGYHELPIMQVRIQSLLSGPTSGYLDVDTNPEETAESLISTYCSQKAIVRNHDWVLYSFANKPLKYSCTLRSLGIGDGHTIYLGKKRAAEELPQSVWKVLIIAGIFLGGGGLLATVLVYTLSGGVIPFDYGVVMDAGSSHTEVALYKWQGDKDYGTGVANQVDSCKIEGGISNYNDSQSVGSLLLPCVTNLSYSVPQSSWTGTPIYLGATAGMRLLNFSDSTKVELILLSVRCALQSTALSIHNISIISGQEEGLFAWITTNFLLKTLYNYEEENEKSKVLTLGAADLGGASTQIAYEELTAIPGDPNIMTVRLFGVTRRIFSKTYLCFGANEAFRRYLALLIQNPVLNTTIIDPCGPEGHTANYTGDFLFNNYCTRNEKFSRWLKEMPEIKYTSYEFRGSSDNSFCEAAVVSLLKGCQKQNFTHCFEPTKTLQDKKIVAFSAYYKVAEFLHLTNASFESYENVTKTFCEKTWDEIKANSSVKWSYLSKYCFDAQYIKTLLTVGYGFNNESWKNVIFEGVIDGSNLGWALGYMITATNAIPEEKPTSHYISNLTLILLLIICTVILVCGIYILITSHNRLFKGKYFFKPDVEENLPLHN